MRRVMLILVAMAMMVSLFAAAAYAAEILVPKMARTTREHADDKISGLQGDDEIFARLYGGDKDKVEGNREDDKIPLTTGTTRTLPLVVRDSTNAGVTRR